MENQEKVEQAVYQLLEALGENPEREGLWIRQNVWLRCMLRCFQV